MQQTAVKILFVADTLWSLNIIFIYENNNQNLNLTTYIPFFISNISVMNFGNV